MKPEIERIHDLNVKCVYHGFPDVTFHSEFPALRVD